MIKIFIDGEEVHSIDERAYRKRIMHVDLRDSAKSIKQEHIDLPIIRDVEIHVVFDPRADTDLAMLEEEARLEQADQTDFPDLSESAVEETPESTDEVPSDSGSDDPGLNTEPADASEPVDTTVPDVDAPTEPTDEPLDLEGS